MERKDAIAKIESLLANQAEPVTGDIQIVVLDRGFVYVGAVTFDDDFLTIKNAHNIRYWGTKNGLGELVGGPLKDTKLDRVGTVKAPVRALISLIDTKAGAWKLGS